MMQRCTRPCAHPPTRGHVPARPDRAPRLPACPVVSINFRQKQNSCVAHALHNSAPLTCLVSWHSRMLITTLAKAVVEGPPEPRGAHAAPPSPMQNEIRPLPFEARNGIISVHGGPIHLKGTSWCVPRSASLLDRPGARLTSRASDIDI
eukprot:5851084-Prymnesium_polylepis.1